MEHLWLLGKMIIYVLISISSLIKGIRSCKITQLKEALRERLDPKTLLYFMECGCFLSSFDHRASSDLMFDLGIVNCWGWSIYSENFLAMLERILHISTSPPSRSLIPSAHLSISSRRFPTFQFHILGLNWFSNFYSLVTWLRVIFLTCSLSFRNSLTPYAREGEFPIGGNLSMTPLDCWLCILLRAEEWFYSSYSNVLFLSFRFWLTFLRASFSALIWTSFSRISLTFFLVGDLASCSNFKLSCNLLI